MGIWIKVATVMKHVERVPKNGYNAFHKYKYATESDLTESIRGILVEAGLALFSSVVEQSRDGEFTKAAVEFTLADTETGETLKSVYWGEGQDKGDKGLYKAYTGAVKYFLMKTFLIPTGDDPEQDSPEVPAAPEQQIKYVDLLIAARSIGLSEEELVVISFGRYGAEPGNISQVQARELRSAFVSTNISKLKNYIAKQKAAVPA